MNFFQFSVLHNFRVGNRCPQNTNFSCITISVYIFGLTYSLNTVFERSSWNLTHWDNLSTDERLSSSRMGRRKLQIHSNSVYYFCRRQFSSLQWKMSRITMLWKHRIWCTVQGVKFLWRLIDGWRNEIPSWDFQSHKNFRLRSKESQNRPRELCTLLRIQYVLRISTAMFISMLSKS